MTALVEYDDVIELYEISSPTSVTEYFTTGENSYDDGIHVYYPAPIKRSPISLSTDMSLPKVTVNAPPIASLLRYLANFPVVPTRMVIKRLTGVTTITLFSGRVKTIGLEDEVVSAACESGSDVLNTIVLKKVCSAFCQNSLFDLDCGIANGTYLLSTTVAPTDDYLTSGNIGLQVDGYYTGGYVQTANLDFRYIVNHVGDDVYLQAPFDGDDVPIGTLVSIYPGCDGTFTTCRDKFNNLHPGGGKGFCGMATIPITNPVIWGIGHIE